MRPSVDRRAVLAGGIAAATGLVISSLIGRSQPATADRAVSRGQSPAVPAPNIVTRAQWGADESLRNGPPAFDRTVRKIVLHHTGTRNDVTDWPLEIRQIYAFETANGYNDLSYNYLVDPHGIIYEGRWARTYPEGSVPDAEDADARPVRGGHCKRHNKRTIGIALLGDLTQVPPTPAAINAVRALVTWKCARWRLDPTGSSKYRRDDGTAEDLPNVFGHGLVRDTECPGNNLTSVIPALCAQVAAQLA